MLKAFDPELHRLVAIKVLAPPRLAGGGAACQRFAQEARAAAVHDEHVFANYGIDEVRGLPYLLMEYVAGVSLQERILRGGPLQPAEVLRIGWQAAQGLVHRDVKPANVLLENGVERVKLTHFGLARAADDASLT